MADDLTDFQKKKLLHIFTIFYDLNRDGVIQWDDFTDAIDKFCQVNNWASDGKEAKDATATLQMIWEGLRKYADENMDDQITKEEWFKMWAEYYKAAKEKTSFPDWLDKYATFMFDVTDTSGDNVVDCEEYSTAFNVFGISKSDCEQSFNTFSENGKVTLTKDEFMKLWHQFFLSDNPNDKGNFLFGPQINA